MIGDKVFLWDMGREYGCKLLWCKRFVGRLVVEYLGGDMTVMPAFCGSGEQRRLEGAGAGIGRG